MLQNIAADNPNTNRQGELISAIWLLFHSMTLTARAVKQLHRTTVQLAGPGNGCSRVS